MEEFYLRPDLKDSLGPLIHFDEVSKISGQIYRQVKNRRTLSFENSGQEFFLKLHGGVGWREIGKNLLQGKVPILGARNEWMAIKRLHKLNVPTMEIAAYGRRYRNPAKQESFLITDALLQTESLEFFCPRYFEGKLNTSQIALRRALIEKVAWITHQLHYNGLNHCDLYICHFLLDLSQGEEALSPDNLTLFLIDLHRVRLRKKIPSRWIIKDLAAIYFSALDLPLTKNDIFRFIRSYREAPLEDIFPQERAFWQKVEKRAINLYRKVHQKEPKLPVGLASF